MGNGTKMDIKVEQMPKTAARNTMRQGFKTLERTLEWEYSPQRYLRCRYTQYIVWISFVNLNQHQILLYPFESLIIFTVCKPIGNLTNMKSAC